jgi:GH25 family lysozyme M1 (1,4-beta-N-acetylmuramidase)
VKLLARTFRLGLMALVAAGGTIPAVSAANAAVEPGPRAASWHPERDFMGSTIAAHEGTQAANQRIAVQPQGIGVLATTAGVDVSHWQGSINWTSVYNAGIRFAYIKDTEGTSYKDPNFNSNYLNAYNAGVIRGAYHFALPDRSTGAAQATYFVNNGGRWSGDGKTLPPALDMEYNPYGASCYGKTQAAMRTWLADFSSTTKRLAGRYPVIYTTTNWWSTCTGNWSGLSSTNALWIARWASAPGTLPAGWPAWTIWQYSSTGAVSGISGNVDRDYFNGTLARVQAFARCPEENPC